jgi:hypothetical protein
MYEMVSAPTILIVCGAGIVSGKEIVSLHLARGLRDAGWNLEFVTSSWGDGDLSAALSRMTSNINDCQSVLFLQRCAWIRSS